MFTIQQIEAAHAQVKSGADFPQYIRRLRELGVSAFETYVSDSHSEYYGGKDTLVSAAKYSVMPVAAIGMPAALVQALKVHQQGGTDYLTFCRQAADAGVMKWRMDTGKMTCTYYDAGGRILLVEQVPV